MTDIKLDTDTHDLIYQDDDYVFINNTVDLLVQRLKIRLLTFKGEDVFDTERGIPYFQIIFKKGTNKTNADSIFRNEIINTPGVKSISSFESVYNTTLRTYQIRKLVVIDEFNTPIAVNFQEVSA